MYTEDGISGETMHSYKMQSGNWADLGAPQLLYDPDFHDSVSDSILM